LSFAYGTLNFFGGEPGRRRTPPIMDDFGDRRPLFFPVRVVPYPQLLYRTWHREWMAISNFST
jgi:hypothetical protein